MSRALRQITLFLQKLPWDTSWPWMVWTLVRYFIRPRISPSSRAATLHWFFLKEITYPDISSVIPIFLSRGNKYNVTAITMMACKDSIIKKALTKHIPPKYIRVYKFHLEWLYSVTQLFMSHVVRRKYYKPSVWGRKKTAIGNRGDIWTSRYCRPDAQLVLMGVVPLKWMVQSSFTPSEPYSELLPLKTQK